MVEPTANISSVGGFVLQVGNWLAAPIWRQFKYLYKYNTNFEYLQEEVEKLKNTRDQVQHKVNDAERNVEGIKPNVKKWQKDVDSIIGKAEQLNQEKANNPRCFKGLCPNLVTRYRHSKKAFKLKENDISQLLDKEFNEVSYPTNPQEIWLRSNEDYLAFESRNSTVKDLWDALNDENISMIGVYGMGGLGKTTLVQEIGRKAEKDKLFDEIVFVEITETLDVKKVQTEIADKLGVKFSNESERANKLYERLKSNKKILLILDNIWKDLHLKTIGIPSKMDRGGCKLLLTTRNLDVLQKMDSTSNFGMSILKDEEAWNLFMKMAGGVIQTRGLNSLPQDVCKECGGLPIVICAIAKALRNKSRSSDWKVVLRELKAPSLTKFGGLLEEEYQKIALSYKYLRNDELRKTFLISSLMGNDTSILDLFKHVVGLDILEGANLTIEEARDSLDKLVYELKDSCLLLEGSRSKQFSMHDVIRVVAMTIAYTDHHVFTVRNDIEKEWKDKDKLRKCTKIYLPGDNVIRQLWHEELDFPNLDFFYMDMNNSIKIHENLFKEMPKLKALNLFRMELPLLPVSLGRLINLQTLCLDYSKIEDFAIIGELKKLKVFSLQSCLCIKELPREISQLTQLRLLDLSNCRKLKVVAPNIISKLSQLEELYTKGCFIQWTVQVLGELKSLSRLTSLELDMNENKILPKGFFSKELKRYKISIGDWLPRYLRINKDESLRMLEFKFNSTISLEEFRGIKNVEILFLAIDVKNSLDELQSNITPIFNEKVAFPDLKVLALVDINFRKIWDSHLPTSYYQNLIHFILEKCRNIKYVFPSTICKSLQQLQCLEICDCKDLEEIVAKEEGIETTVNFVFPQVTLLTLKNLPKLVAFYPRKHTVEWPKLKELVLRNCDKISLKYLNFEENNEDGLHISESKSLFLNDKINPDLDEMILELKKKYINWHSQSKALEIRHDVSTNIPFELLHTFKNLKELDLCCNEYKELFFPNLPNLEVLHVISCCRLMSLVPSSASFQNLKVLRVDRCNGLMKLITPSTVKSLMQLREMRVENCMVLKEIVGKEEGANAVFNFVFPNVTLLQLENLPELTTFYPERHTSEWPKLKVLRLRYCVKLSSKHLSFKENNEESELNISDSKSIYLEDKINQDLEVFELNNHDAYICWDSRSKALKIIGDKPTNVPLGLLHNGEYKELFFPIPNFEALDGTMDSSRLVDVKQRIADDGDKVKSWKIPDVSEPSQIKALRLPDSIAPSKVVRLIYTNSGVALLALTASAVHKLWKWQRSERNPLGKATVHVAPQLWQPLSGTLMTNDVTDGEPAEESAACIALSKNDGYVISASGGEVSLFNIYTFKVMKTFMPPPPAATYLAFHPQDNNIIAIGMEDSTIQIYNVRVNKVITKLKGHQNRITGLAFSRVLNALLSSGADGQLCMWSIDKWEKLKSRFIQAPAGRQSPLVGETKVQFHDDQRHLLVVHDSQISIYDSKLECSRSWSPKDSLPAPISSAIYSCYSLLVYAGFCDGAVGVFDASDLRLRCRIAASAYIPSFPVSNTTTYPFVISAHPSEPNQIALGMSDGAVHVVELSDAELKWGGTPSQDNSSLLIR